MQTVTRRTRISSVLIAGLLALYGLFTDVRPALAQTQIPCPLPAGTTPPADPAVTAQQVQDGSASLKDFALAVRERSREYAQGATTNEEGVYIGCIIRQDDGIWRSGSTYIVSLTLDGRVYIHAKDMALSGRQLNPLIYGSILYALGVSPSVLTNLASPDPATRTQAYGTLRATLLQEPDGAFDATIPIPGQSPGIPGASGHTAVYLDPNLGSPIVLLVGFDIDESHLAEEDIDPGDPAITARDVVDRETLKTFVTQAGEHLLEFMGSGDPAAASKFRLALRDENGPWRHGSVYLYVLDLTSNIITFHAAFPDEYEYRPLIPTVRDAVTGEFILPQVIEAAKGSPEGGFVEYYFDDPTDDTDRADVPKVGYAREFAAEIRRPDGSVAPADFIIGSGFYGRAPETVATCPLPAGVALPADPTVTAQQVEDGSATLKEFALAVRDQHRALSREIPTFEGEAYFGCLIRQDGSPYRSGSTFLVSLAPDGSVLVHSKAMALSGRKLNPVIYGTIFQALGARGFTDLFAAANSDGGSFDVPDIPGASGYATVYMSPGLGVPVILIAGFDLNETHLVKEAIDYGDPAITASDVVDRETLKDFVTEAGSYLLELGKTGGRNAIWSAKDAMRDSSGPWRHGSVYLYVLDLASNLIMFHGAFPDQFEFLPLATTVRDAVTGELIIPQLIEAAKSNPEGSFVEYYFDDPDDDTDSADVPKVGYALRFTGSFKEPDGSFSENEFIVGSGFYGRAPDDVAACPLPDGVSPPADPAVTAQQVEAGTASLRDFALAARELYENELPSGSLQEALYIQCRLREEEGPWRTGSTYLVNLSPDGRVHEHTKSMALAGRQLNPLIYGTILSALGVSPADLINLESSDPAIIAQAFGAVIGVLSQRPDGAFDATVPIPGLSPGIPGASGHAAVYSTPLSPIPFVLLAGFDLNESHLVPISAEDIDYGDPTVRASDVVDRETLKAFVTEAQDYIVGLLQTVTDPSVFAKARIALRDPSGPWRHGSVYLYILDRTSNVILFHGAFPDRFEYRPLVATVRDAVTGELILPQVLAAAASDPEGGFVEYYFDDPTDATDSADVPKVGYAREFTYENFGPDGTSSTSTLVIGSGFYGRAPDDVATCPLPDGVSPPADPTVTAQQVEAGTANLRDFALAARERLNVELGDGVYLYNLCLIRQEGGPYRSGSTYLVQLTLDRRVYVHAKQMALSGRRLKPSIFGEILAALGVSPADLGRLRSIDPAIRGPALAALNNTLSQEPENLFDATASVPGASGHVSSYYSDILGVPIIQLAGFDLNETHLDEEVIDYGDPAITAEDVVDRKTLKAFVAEAGKYYLNLFQTDNRATDTKSRLALRDENGPWRHGSVYLYVLDLNSNTILVHGAFPDRFEFRPLVATVRDAVTGKLILPQVIEAAKSDPEGGFVEYYFDDPADDTDSADVPKVGYARQFKGELPRADGSALSINVIIGSGFYGQEPTIPTLPVGDVTAADVVDRATLASFVQSAASAYAGAIDEAGFESHDDVVEAFRVDDGTWRDGDVYLYITEPDGTFIFHGVNPSLEGQNLIQYTDLNGVMYVKELLDAARGGGGYVEYYFDDPTVTGDEELGSPKVGYAELVVAGGRDLVIGSGIYPDLSDYELEIALSTTPATLTEEGGVQKVTVTATQSSAPIEVSSVIDLSLSGTATADDYSVSGEMNIRIPAGAVTGSTELTFTVADDTTYEFGGETIVISARSRGADLGTATVMVTDSYQAPAAVGAPPAVTLEAGDSETIDAGPLFSGTDLSYSASWTDNGVAEAVMSGATLTVTGVRKGGATVTVAARNAAGEASLAVSVTVTAIAAEREAYTNILAAMGRSMLSGVSATIGGRFGGGHGQGITVGGRRIDGLASGVTALAGLTGHGRQAVSKEMALLTGPERRRVASGDYLLRTSSFSYALEDHTGNGGLRWSVWGAGDLQNFQGEPGADASYDGDLKSAYLGFDVATGRSWLMGIALSRATGQSDYDVTVASGSLESRLTAVLPYLRWTCSTGFTEVWSIVGLGAGEAEVEDGTSDLSMRMGMLGARFRLASSGGLGLDLVGDAGLVRLSTSDSESAALRDITTGVQRIRVGLEGSRATALAGGATVTPYAQVAGRYDGGDGQTGQGLEVSGGLRLTGGRVGLDARGRFLAVHTAEGYSENGVSLVAYLRAKADGRGLSMSVAPRMGAGTGDSGMMWRERPLADSALRGGIRARSLQAEVGYGLASSPTGLLLTPFGDLYLDGDERRQVRLGARIGAADLGSRIGSLELSGARIDRRGGASDHRIGLIGRMSF